MPCINWKMFDVTGNEAIGIGSDCNFKKWMVIRVRQEVL